MAQGPPQQAAPGDPESPAEGAALNHEQFAEQFANVSRRLWCVAVAILGDPHQAEDAVQEAAVIGIGKVEQYRPGTSFAAWMGQIVRYVALNQKRRHARQQTAPTDPANLGGLPAADQANPRSSAPISRHGTLRETQEAFDDQVVEALGRLEETARGCLLLRTVLDLSYKEIAELMDVPEGTAMSHVHRARRAMRRSLERRGTEPDSDRFLDAESRP